MDVSICGWKLFCIQVLKISINVVAVVVIVVDGTRIVDMIDTSLRWRRELVPVSNMTPPNVGSLNCFRVHPF